MLIEAVKINSIPAMVYGEKSDKVYLFAHGQNGYKEEAEPFAELVESSGWQVISIDLPGHVFCRIHVDDIVGAALASLARPDVPGEAAIYNVADDEPASGSAVTEYACDLLGLSWPPLQTLDEAGLSPMARGFYSESRRVRNDKLKQQLGYILHYPTYREGLRACLAASE